MSIIMHIVLHNGSSFLAPEVETHDSLLFFFQTHSVKPELNFTISYCSVLHLLRSHSVLKDRGQMKLLKTVCLQAAFLHQVFMELICAPALYAPLLPY